MIRQPVSMFAKIKYDTNYVQVNAVAASTSSKVAIRPDEATAKSDSMSGMPFDMRNVSITADTTTLLYCCNSGRYIISAGCISA